MLIGHNLQIIVINAVTILNLKGVLPVDLTCKGKTRVKRNVDTCVQFQLCSSLIHLFHRKQI